MLVIKEQVLDGESSSEIMSRNFDAYTCPLCKAMTLFLLEVIAAMIEGRVQGSFPCKREKREHLEAYHTAALHAAMERRFFSVHKWRKIFG